MIIRNKIAIIGSEGYVGKAYADYFSVGYGTLLRRDPVLTYGGAAWRRINNEALLAVVCVPTPSKKSQGRGCDTSIVGEVVSQMPDVPLILIKSAVPPGTTDELNGNLGTKNIVVSPEYLGEGGYTVPWWEGHPHPTDVSKHNFQIFGGYPSKTQACVDIFQRISGPDCRYFQTDAKTAELVKYMENAYYATKVTFCNEFYGIAEAFDVDYRELRELWLMDNRISRNHTAVFPDDRGFGGKCLPKDLNAIIWKAGEMGYHAELLSAVRKVNNELATNKENS